MAIRTRGAGRTLPRDADIWPPFVLFEVAFIVFRSEPHHQPRSAVVCAAPTAARIQPNPLRLVLADTVALLSNGARWCAQHQPQP